jgi:hypothetical protein
MPKTKGTGINWLRDMIDHRGPAAAEALSKALSPEDHIIFRSAMPVAWIPEETATRIYVAAGNILFSGKPDAVVEVGRGMAKANLTGIYKLLLPLVTTPFILKQASRLWRTYHDTGETSVEEVKGENRIIFSVGKFPELPAEMRQVLRGYMLGLAEMVGVRNPTVELDEKDNNSWKWIVTWE